MAMIGAAGGAQVPQHLQNLQESKADAKDIMTAMKNLMTDLKELSGELKGQQSVKSPLQQDGTATQNTANQVQQQDVPQTGQQAQAKHDPDASQAAAAASVMDDADDLKAKQKKKQLDFNQKLELLASMEGLLADVEIDDAQQKEQLKQFFENMSRIKNLNSRLTQLETQEEHLEDQLERQAAEEARDAKNKDKKPEEKEPHTQATSVPQHQIQAQAVQDYLKKKKEGQDTGG
ncbi:hypothetical protein HOH87_02865 [bacterium]|jgi:hypothetical protein|nr:hypothetical protein [bacterium]